MADNAVAQMTVEQLADTLAGLIESGAGETPVVVNVSDRIVLPVLGTAVKAHKGHSYFEVRAADLTPDEDVTA
ncbi:hypothetical protein [Saccharopolyspora hordei]|uniref:Uncharacterized protein n=1 Tax=Saccharopolyspora hordei TaxID=1838 RepID=A0A853ASZ8_9PSEU|nr:hypothetical protein [Saccharopolyspora hordei]NYI85650.1 hypothetical protein [Saccharopolyspora hordei]